VLLALLSSLVWGTSDFVAGLRSRSMPAMVVIAWSQGIALLALTVVLLRWGLPFPTDHGWARWAILAGVTGSLGLVCFYTALATGTMGVVAPIAALGGGLPVLLGVLTGEAPSTVAWAGIAVALVGVVLASGPELQAGLHVRPVFLAAGAAGCFGVALFAIDRGSRLSLLHTLWGMRATSAVGYAALALSQRTLGGVRRPAVPVLAAIGVADLTANALFGLASSSGLVSLASVLGSLYPVVTILLARVVLHERLRPVQLAGVAVSILGICLIAAGGARS
jgi:drug/metabolite transporter (DMT)-like permease